MKIKINGNFYNFFNNISINYKLDSVASTFSFAARFNPDNKLHREIFKPLQYHSVEILSNNDELLLTGTVVATNLTSSSNRELQTISGYSKAGVIEDCTIPVSSYPLEKNKVSLDNIVRSVLQGFDVSYVVDKTAQLEMKMVYDKTVAGATETIKSFISKLASQRNIILSHNEKGDLLFFKPDFNSKSKLFLTVENTLTMKLNANGQSLHSKVSVIRQPSKDNSSLSPVDTVTNHLVALKRPIVKVLSSGNETDTKKAADNIMAEELKNISFDVELNRIENVKPGDLVDVLNPEISIYKRTTLVISSCVLKQTSSSETMSINLVLPETFTGKQPKNIFDD